MRTICRNSFARQTILAERVSVTTTTCTECGSQRQRPYDTKPWLYRFHVDDDSGPRHSGLIAHGKLFCSRECAETYTNQRFDETAGVR